MDASLEDMTNRRQYELGDTTHLGRSKSCQIHIAEARISRQHAMIRRQDSGDFFYDLGSANGSYINGRRVTIAQLLENGDEISLSDHKFRYRRGDSAGLAGETGIDEMSFDATIADVQLSQMLILVSDIRGFSKLSENLPPEALAQAIGGWYRECNRVIKASGGTVDKFSGDALLAYWPNTSNEFRRNALVAAGLLRQVCEQIQSLHADAFDGLDIDFDSGVGIHLGNIAHGSMSQGVFTLLGDAVNVAFRIEALTRPLQKEILVSEDFLEGWDAEGFLFESQGNQEIKGRSASLVIYSVAELPGEDTL